VGRCGGQQGSGRCHAGIVGIKVGRRGSIGWHRAVTDPAFISSPRVHGRPVRSGCRPLDGPVPPHRLLGGRPVCTYLGARAAGGRGGQFQRAQLTVAGEDALSADPRHAHQQQLVEQALVQEGAYGRGAAHNQGPNSSAPVLDRAPARRRLPPPMGVRNPYGGSVVDVIVRAGSGARRVRE
jgi:hypothetical protein